MILVKISQKLSHKYFRISLAIVALLLLVSGVDAFRAAQTQNYYGNTTSTDAVFTTMESTSLQCAASSCTSMTTSSFSTSVSTTPTIATSTTTQLTETS